LPSNVLLVDAYAAQHPGVPSPQAIQSVAVHLLTLNGILERGVGLENALWLRRRALRQELGPKHSHFIWLTPPDFSGSLTVADIVAGPTPQIRAERVQQYSHMVWSRWSQLHLATLSAWYDRYIL
jgi:hypothetical protein